MKTISHLSLAALSATDIADAAFADAVAVVSTILKIMQKCQI